MNLYISTLRAIVARVPAVVAHLSPRAKLLAGLKADIADINAMYHDAITSALINYFEGAGVAGPRNQFKQAMIQAFADAFDAGWVAGGGELPIDDDAMAWLEERLNQEASYIDGLFQEAHDLRKDPEADWFQWISRKVDGYVRTLATVHNQALQMMSADILLEFGGNDGKENCATCAKLKGKRHRLSWWINRGLVPGPGNENYECNGYNCHHYLFNPKTGERFTN